MKYSDWKFLAIGDAMKVANIILDMLWGVLGGWLMAAIWAAVALVLAVTVVGLPLAVQALKLVRFCVAPFGTKVELSNGSLSFLANLVWLSVGLPLATAAVIWGLLLCLTVVGIPFGIIWLKLARLFLQPFGTKVK